MQIKDGKKPNLTFSSYSLNLKLYLKVVIKTSFFWDNPENVNFMIGLTVEDIIELKVSETLDSLFADAAYDKRFRKTLNKLEIGLENTL